MTMSEADDQRAFAKWLKQERIPFFWQRLDRKATGTEGWPDFSLVRNNHALLMEFKTQVGTLSKIQKQRHEEIAASGTKVHVIRKLVDAIELTQAWLSTLPAPTAAEPEQDRSRLWQHAGYVWKLIDHIGHMQVRKCGPGDMALPPLFGK